MAWSQAYLGLNLASFTSSVILGHNVSSWNFVSCEMETLIVSSAVSRIEYK